MKLPRIFRSKKTTNRPRRVVASGMMDSSVSDFNDVRPPAQDQYADQIFSPGDRKDARARCRKLILDNPTAFHLAVSQMLSTVGNPGSLQVKTLDPALAAAVEKKFRRWATGSGLWRQLGKMVMALPFDGESFAILKDVGTSAMKIRMIEAKRVNSPPSETTNPNAFDGIEFDPETGDPVAYFIERKIINPAIDRGNEWDKLPAASVLHLFLDFMGEQHRGWPLLDASVRPLRSIEDLRQETIEGTRTAARIAGVISSEDSQPEDDDGVSYEAMDQISLPRRGLLLLGNNMKASQFKVDPPGANLKEFHDLNVTIAGAATMTPRNIATNDSSNYNFSSARLDHILYDQWVGYLRRHLKEILSKVFTAWLVTSMAQNDPEINALVAESGNIISVPHDWYFQDTVLDEATATDVIVKKITNSLMTYKDYYASQGKDWEVEFQQIAAEKARMAELGITPPDLVTAPGGSASQATPVPSPALEGDGTPEPPPAMIPKLRTAQDLAQEMGLPAGRISGWRKLGLPSYKLGGRILFDPEAVAAFVQKGSTK